MNYSKIYNNLVQSAQLRPDIAFLNGYTEIHHIIPKSMGGSDEKDNLVKLTAREHFVAHHLLWKMYKNKQMLSAFWGMCNQKHNGRNYKVTARLFEIARKSMIPILSEMAKKRTGEKNPFYGKNHSTETRLKLSKIHKGRKMTPEQIEKIRKACTGRKHSPEIMKQRGLKYSGINHPCYGKKLSDEHKRKISEAGKGRTHSPKTIELLRKINTGRVVTQETRDKISKANKKRKGKPRKPQKMEFLIKNKDNIINDLKNGLKHKDVANKYGVSEKTYIKFKNLYNIQKKY